MVMVDSDAALANALATLASSSVVAVDTEFVRERTFYPEVGLLQLGVGDQVYLIDPLTITVLDGLRELMQRPQTVKVLHSASEDLEVFQRWLGTKPQPLYDTQIAAGLLGLGFGLGYRALVESELDIVLDKEETRSNWLARPLSEAQLHYAALDVLHLYTIYTTWQQRFADSPKQGWVLAEGAAAMRETVPEDYYRKVKSAWKLSRQELAVLKALCYWREQTAMAQNKPRNWIVDDKACLTLATRQPTTAAELDVLQCMPAATSRRHGQALLELIAGALALDESQWPEPLPEPLGRDERRMLKQVRGHVQALSETLNAAPQLLFSSRDAEQWVRNSQPGAHQIEPESWQGWRQKHVIQPLKALLAGEGR